MSTQGSERTNEQTKERTSKWTYEQKTNEKNMKG